MCVLLVAPLMYTYDIRFEATATCSQTAETGRASKVDTSYNLNLSVNKGRDNIVSTQLQVC